MKVEFVVDKDGSILEAEAINLIGGGCDEEAVRVVKSVPRFKPATQNGKPVRVRMVVPVVFQLKAGETNPDNSVHGMVIIEKIQYKHNRLRVEARHANGEWIGTVHDEDYNELPGDNIVVPGTPAGTTSAEDGTFKLKSDEAYGIVVSFVGYETVALTANIFTPGKNWPEIMEHPGIVQQRQREAWTALLRRSLRSERAGIPLSARVGV